MDFDGLLVDLKVNIFDYLPHNDLKNASLACKSWHEEIFNSARLLRKFKLSIGYDRVFEAFHYKTEREEMYRRDVLVFLRRYGHVFQYIKMVGVFTMDEFKDLLRLIPNVIQLKLNNVNITTEPKKSYYDRIYFPNINKLVLKGCSNTWKVTNFLKNAQVKELHIDKWTTGKMKPDKQYMDWLHRRYRLEHLEVIDREWGSALRLFRDIQFDYVQFKLKTFFIRCPEFSIPENNYLLRFLQHQNELEKVVLSAGYMVFTSKIFQHIFYELNDLNSVEILILFRK